MTNQEIIDHLESKGFEKHPYKPYYKLSRWIIVVKDTKFRLTNDNPNFEVIGRIDTLEFLDKLLLDLKVYS